MSSAASYPKFRAVDPSTGLALVGGKLWTYAAGTTTPQATYSNSGLTVANANPIILDANGEAVVYVGPLAYKFVLQDSTGAAIWTFDNYAPDITAQTATEWTPYGGAVVYTSATSFRTTGVDTTATFTVGRRVKATVTAGTVYGTVTTSAFAGGNTDVTLIMDGTSALDAGLTAVYSGLLSYSNPSYLDPRSLVSVSLTANIAGWAAKAQVTGWTKRADALNEFAGNQFTAKYAGNYLVQMQAESRDTVAASVNHQIFMNVNGTDVANAVNTSSAVNQFVATSATRVLSLAAGDRVQMWFQGAVNTSILQAAGLVDATFINIARLP